MEKSENNTLVLDGFNFTAGLVALAVLKKGGNVSIHVGDVKNEFQPELSCFYPTVLTKAPQSIKNFQFLLKCSTLFPHLFFPTRVLFFPKSQKLNAGFYSSIDKLLGRDRESSTLLMTTEKFPDYKDLSAIYPKGALLFEYAFDRNQATIELLKMCINSGAKIITIKDENYSKAIKCTQPEFQYIIDLKENSPRFKNSIRIQHQNFDFCLMQSQATQSVQIQNIQDLSLPSFIKEIDQVLKTLGILVSNKQIEKIYINQALSDTSNDFIDDTGIPNLRASIANIEKRVSTVIGKKINVDSIFGSVKEFGITGEKFRTIQNECDEKFDLAKQTGINYQHFMHLFYRYRWHIDDFIDQAYGLMNSERDPIIIWGKILQDFLSSQIPIG